MAERRFMSERMDGLVVIIPAYEPPEEFVEYARQVSEFAEALIVVNDGSKAEFNSVFDRISKLSNVVYIGYEENVGKGHALKTAFDYCAHTYPSSYTMVTADCDGQHRIEDIIKVYKVSKRNPDAMVLGSRNFSLPNVPKRSYAGNTNIRNIYRFLYGLDLADTQTGLRGFSVGLAEPLISVGGNRFEYEIGVLIHGAKTNIPIIEVPIATVYPEDPKDHVSHFKSVRDSARVLGVVLKNLNWYIFSSTISAVLDVLTFFLLTTFLLSGTNAVEGLIATVSARVVSSIFNFVFNYKYVFGGKRKSAVFRYYLLWLLQLGASYAIVVLFGRVVGIDGIWLTLIKGAWDLFLAVISYAIQRAWVFADKENGVFWSFLGNMGATVARAFSKKYRSSVVKADEGVVYVCRHLNMHGPYTTLKWLGFNVHPMVFSPFFNSKDCYNHYINYTFTEKKGKKAGRFNLGAWLSSRITPLGVSVVRSIPVYRNSIEAVKTFRACMDALLDKESIIVYADVDYTSCEEGAPEIYDGFLYLGQLYKKKVGKSLKFIPLYIDEENSMILEGVPVFCDSFKEDKGAAIEALSAGLGGDIYN